MNRNSKIDVTARKRLKIDDKTVHLYPPLHGEDDVSYGRNIELLKAEIGKPKPRTDVLKDLMGRTFPNRWDNFVNRSEPATLLQYLSEFPLLKKTTYVSIITNLALL